MKVCPSCSAELDDKEEKCPICEYSFEAGEGPVKETKSEVSPHEDISKRLREMKSRIQQLTVPMGDEAEAAKADEQRATEEIMPSGEEEIPSEMPEPQEAKEEPEIASAEIEEIVEEPAIVETIETIEEAPVEEEQEPIVTAEVVKEETVVEEEARPRDRGAVNGLGLPTPGVEKAGYPERIGYKLRPTKQLKESGIRRIHIAAAVTVIFIIIFASWYVLILAAPTNLPVIDGQFDDWEDTAMYASIFSSDNPEIDFTGAAVQYHSSTLYWYLSTDGEFYKTSDYITNYALFIDADGDSSTGFSLLPDFGADAMAQISGIGGQREAAKVMQFAGEDSYNWSAKTTTQSLVVASLTRRAETSMNAPSGFSESDARFVCVSYDGTSSCSITSIFSLSPGVLVVEQSSLVDDSGVIQAGTDQPVLQISLRGYGAVHSVSSLLPSVSGVQYSQDLGPITWSSEADMSQGETATVELDLSSVADETLVRAEIAIDGIVTDYPSVMVIGTGAIGYVGSLPPGITIDGCFGDWNNLDLDNDIVPVEKSDVNIVRTSHESTTDDAFFFAEVAGHMINGTPVPSRSEKIVPGGEPGEPSPPERVTGEDIFRIFIDTDPETDIGAPSPTPESTIRPEYKVEIRGLNGVITYRALCEWNGDWETTSVQISAASGEHKIELSFPKASLAGLNNSSILVQMTDWKGYGDNQSFDGVVIDPFKVNLTGKIWGSLDGTVWTPKTEVVSSTSSLMDLTSDSAGYLYAVFSNGTVYRSTDFAESWTRLIVGSLTDVQGITCDRSSQLYSILGVGDVYNVSTTGGTWTLRGSASGTDYIDIDWVSGINPAVTVLYATKPSATSNIVRSLDGGSNWANLASKPPANSSYAAINAVRSGPNDIVYLLETDGDIRVSNDSGSTWTATRISSGGSTDFVSSPCVDLDIDDANNLWVVRSQGEVYKLTVSTWTWTTLYASGDVSEIQAFSTAPIPEFADGILIAMLFIVITAIYHMRRRRTTA